MTEPLDVEIHCHRGLLGLNEIAEDWSTLGDSIRAKGLHHRIEWVRSQLEALEPNPDFSVRARLASGGRPGDLLQRAIVWAVLLVAVAVLGVLTLRVARRAPPPGGSGGPD